MAAINDITSSEPEVLSFSTEVDKITEVLHPQPGPGDVEKEVLAGDRSKPGPAGINYGDILRRYGVEPNRVEFHWQVGRLELTQGWLLHLSIVRSQIQEAVEELIPFFLSIGITFRIVQDYDTAIRVLDGNLGLDQLGKVITVYPSSDENAAQIARELIRLTAPYRGPVILTDAHLGCCVYTRYGAFAAVMRSDAAGRVQKYVYAANGDLIRDIEQIPFMLPEGRKWPFVHLASHIAPTKEEILHDRYRALEYLKSDPRGNVFKAHYLTKHFLVKTCLVKQGVRDMWSDDSGRDMRDRLRWQKDLYHQLKDIIPMPRIIECFEENGDIYLAMEFVKGNCVFDYITKQINPNCEWFYNWAESDQLQTLDVLIEICNIVETFHEHGFVNRDVTPVNFMVEKKGILRRLLGNLSIRGKRNRLKVIDIELAYSLRDGQPGNPFTFGTFGFMSPQQVDALQPSVKEDIYGLAATILTTLTGIPPLAFDTANTSSLEDNLQFFILDRDLVQAICSGLSFSPNLDLRLPAWLVR